ncbi:hypothetical protein [Paracoccus sp. IB05]|uniref:hypothetical protein n=1 Tax=Paracoccus sp. IB05 TaxID=2779367 RepID=UPI0018E8A1A1|nr:hypothetical protein [Paracoccus sp. IB05]MBJ2150158.1 hypothetical protein [Paracoccus sp. IB05]
MTNIHRKAVFLSAAGGRIDFVHDESGELLASVAIPPGRIDAAPYLDIEIEGATAEIIDVAVVNPRSAYGAVEYGEGSFDTAANPEFQPTPASALEADMRHMMRKLQGTEKRLQARMAALDTLERIPDNPEPLIEAPAPSPEPAPVPSPAPAAE